MLTTDQKEALLRRAGIAVPAFPAGSASGQQQQADASPLLELDMQADGQRNAIDQWSRTVDALFTRYAAERDARSLREAEQVRAHGMLDGGAPRAAE